MNLLSQIIIPMPIYHGGGHIGPWTETETKILITINIVLFIFWITLVTLNYLTTRKSYPNDTFFTFLKPLGSWGEWAVTGMTSCIFYSLTGLELLVGLGFLIYNLIF